MGSAIIVDVHFHSACLYSGLEVSTLALGLSVDLVCIGFEGGTGVGFAFGDVGAFAGVDLGAACCCDGV